MPNELFNEAERFLVEQWAEARLLEESMENVRNKYKSLFQRVAEAVVEDHPELDVNKVYVTQFWGKGSLGFSRSAWPSGDAHAPPGLWLDSIRLEELTAEDAAPPSAIIWVSLRLARSIGLNVADARRRLAEMSKQSGSSEKLDGVSFDDTDSEVLARFAAPGKREMIELLLKGEGQEFVERLVSLVDAMARFVPALDSVLVVPKKVR